MEEIYDLDKPIVTPEVEQIYQEFWKDIICNEDGSINIDAVKCELADYYKMLQEVPTVYSEITGGILSKPLYKAEFVLEYFREKYYDKAIAVDYLADDWDLITAECETNEDYKEAVFEYLNVEE